MSERGTILFSKVNRRSLDVKHKFFSSKSKQCPLGVPIPWMVGDHQAGWTPFKICPPFELLTDQDWLTSISVEHLPDFSLQSQTAVGEFDEVFYKFVVFDQRNLLLVVETD